MTNDPMPVGYDNAVIAKLLCEIRDELRELNAKQPGMFKRLFSNIYIRMTKDSDA